MTRLGPADDYQPIAWIGRYPIYTPTLLVIVHFITMIFGALIVGFGNYSFLAHLVFSSRAVIDSFQLWQLFTYAFVNQPSFWFLVEMAMLYFFGRQVEGFVGRRAFLGLYALLLLLPACFLTAIGPWIPIRYAGSQILHFCVFIAFACLYPRAELLFSIQSRWVALGLFGIYVLQMLSNHAWAHLLILLLSASTAFLFIWHLRHGFEIPAQLRNWMALLPWKRRRKVIHPNLHLFKSAPPAPRKDDPMKTVDALLEKISENGLGSLTGKEREQLASASEELKRRQRHLAP